MSCVSTCGPFRRPSWPPAALFPQWAKAAPAAAGKPRSHEFMTAYQAALSGEEAPQPASRARQAPSIVWCRITRQPWLSTMVPSPCGVISSLRPLLRDEKNRASLVAQMTRQHVLNRRPPCRQAGAATNLLKKIRVLSPFASTTDVRQIYRHFASKDSRKANSTLGPTRKSSNSNGTGLRTAGAYSVCAVAIYGPACLRREEDAWSDVVENTIHVIQGNTGESFGYLCIPSSMRCSTRGGRIKV